jgi:glucose dehydrogenase
MRRFLFLVASTGLIGATVVALATASHAAKTAATPAGFDAETAWPWEPQGSVPAGTTDNNWQTGKGDLADTQFSYLKQITSSNVGGLKVAWQNSYADPSYSGGIQGSPIVVSGKGKNLPMESATMFLSAAKGIVAIDPSTGKVLWQYIGPNPKPNTPGGAPAAQLQYGNTTKAISFCNGEVTTGQQDGSIAAINAKTGAPIWTNQVSAVSEFAGHTGQTSPVTDCDPNAGPNHDGLVFGGPNGSSSPLRGHMDAIDLKTGQLVWRWFTTPDPTQLPFILTWGNPAEAALGGGGTWGSSSIDPGLGLICSATGNAYAQLGRQPGKDYWTASTFCLHEDTGQLAWFWQEGHHDNWDLDHSHPPILFNTTINGKVYPAFLNCNKVANCEVLDRRNGSPLPNFPMKETPVYDYSGKGLALNNEYPTQPWFGCNQAQMGINGVPAAQAASVQYGATMPAGTPCGMSYLIMHDPTNASAAWAYPTFPVAPDGNPMVARPVFTSTYSDSYSVNPTCSCGYNYNRSTYDAATNSFIGCGNGNTTAQMNASPTDWHKLSTGGVLGGVWITSVDMSKNTINWQRFFTGAKYVNGALTPGVNAGFTDGTWSKGCYGGNFSTAGNLVFVTAWGDNTRNISTLTSADKPYGGTLAAFNATTGEGPLWAWQAPGYINGSGITYQVNGKQYVAVYSQAPVQGTPLYTGHGEVLTAFSL